MENTTSGTFSPVDQQNTKFCCHCGAKILANAVICPHCGCQIEEVKQSAAAPSIVINNANSNVNQNTNGVYMMKRPKNKWVAFFLCFFLGSLGIHKFYEGKVGLGILYIFTLGLFGIGWLVDWIVLLCKPNPYYV